MYALRGFTLSLQEIKETLEKHLIKFQDFYKNYAPDIDPVEELNKLFNAPLQEYNNDTSDLYIFALGNAYDVNVVFFQSTNTKCYIVDISNEDPFPDTLYFARTLSPHVDPVIPIQVSKFLIRIFS